MNARLDAALAVRFGVPLDLFAECGVRTREARLAWARGGGLPP